MHNTQSSMWFLFFFILLAVTMHSEAIYWENSLQGNGKPINEVIDELLVYEMESPTIVRKTYKIQDNQHNNKDVLHGIIEFDGVTTVPPNTTDAKGGGVASNVYFIVGGAALLVIIIVVIAVICCCCCRKSQRKTRRKNSKIQPQNVGEYPTHMGNVQMQAPNFQNNSVVHTMPETEPPPYSEIAEPQTIIYSSKDNFDKPSAPEHTESLSSISSGESDIEKMTNIVVQPQIHSSDEQLTDNIINMKKTDNKTENEQLSYITDRNHNDHVSDVTFLNQESRDKVNSGHNKGNTQKYHNSNLYNPHFQRIDSQNSRQKKMTDYHDHDLIRNSYIDHGVRKDDYSDWPKAAASDHENNYLNHTSRANSKEEREFKQVNEDQTYLERQNYSSEREKKQRNFNDQTDNYNRSSNNYYREKNVPIMRKDSRYKEPYASSVRQELHSVLSNQSNMPSTSLVEPSKIKEQVNMYHVPTPDYANDSTTRGPIIAVYKPREFKGPYGPEDLDDLNNPYTLKRGKQTRGPLN